jgi:hypothetical protein
MTATESAICAAMSSVSVQRMSGTGTRGGCPPYQPKRYWSRFFEAMKAVASASGAGRIWAAEKK